MNFPVATDKMTSWPGRAIIDTSKGIPPFIGRYAEITGVRIKKIRGKPFILLRGKKAQFCGERLKPSRTPHWKSSD